MIVASGLTFIVRVSVAAAHEPLASVVSVNVTVPVKLAAGVYVTADGLAVCAPLLNVPPPLVIVHTAVVALPPTVAPVRVIGEGVAD